MVKNEYILLNFATFSLDIVENTHSKQQETFQIKINEHRENFSFDVLQLPEKWIMGFTILRV